MTTYNKPKVHAQVVQSLPKRMARRPQHPFFVEHKPFQITPFFIAPVLPGETMKNLLLQTRCVTDPINNPLVGWWLEHYFFYIKLRDLDIRDKVERMILEADYDIVTAQGDTEDVGVNYHYDGVNWVKHCLDRVVDEFFRDEGESISIATLDGLPLAQYNGNNVFDSYTPYADLDTTSEVTDAEPLDEFEKRYQLWLTLRQQQLTELDFEDYLRTFGVRTSRSELHKPELVRYVRNWQYPTNTISNQPVTVGEDVIPAGTPSAAVSWSVAERADKDRFFVEPGFLFGVTLARPKLYLGNQRGTATGLMVDTMSWLPAILRDNPETSLLRVPSGDGPLNRGAEADDYLIDIRDLLVYGEQFINSSSGKYDPPTATLPDIDDHTLSRYPIAADIAALFVDDTPNNRLRQDGVVSLSIMGTQTDYT